MSGGEEVSWHWRQAMNIACQFPEKASDAWLVLDYVEKLLQLGFDPPPALPPETISEGQLVRFPGGANSPSRRATSRGRPSVLPK
jgi:hypothetical protein